VDVERDVVYGQGPAIAFRKTFDMDHEQPFTFLIGSLEKLKEKAGKKLLWQNLKIKRPTPEYDGSAEKKSAIGCGHHGEWSEQYE
jgi:hypothetical protein